MDSFKKWLCSFPVAASSFLVAAIFLLHGVKSGVRFSGFLLLAFAVVAVWGTIDNDRKKQRLRELSSAERLRVAYHEAGHVVVGGAFEGVASTIIRATINPDGCSLGHVLRDERYIRRLLKASEYREYVAYILAGRMAEEQKFTHPSSACSDDMRKVHAVLREMIAEVGFGDGELACLRLEENDRVSETLLVMIETAERKEIHEQAARAKAILKANLSLLDDIAGRLLEAGILEKEELHRFIGRVQRPS